MTSPSKTNENNQTDAVPPIVDQDTWGAALAELRAREKAATRELDAIAAARRRLPMVETLVLVRLDGEPASAGGHRAGAVAGLDAWRDEAEVSVLLVLCGAASSKAPACR